MADAIVCAQTRALNTPFDLSNRDRAAAVAATGAACGGSGRPGFVPEDGFASPGPADPGVFAADEAMLLSMIERHACTTLGELVSALPEHPYPIAAVLALEETGLIEIDRRGPFDSDLKVWRFDA